MPIVFEMTPNLCASTLTSKFKIQANFKFQEFWFTAATSFFYLTAFAAQLADFSGVTDEVYQYWYDAQVAAGVS